ncbi:uncharacterized protein [Euphorbia lathyris]|uniref:uncharacterized protein n=1 Tax=Euphorbia lathyris TaxID=212925 RepID=UPI0033132C73
MAAPSPALSSNSSDGGHAVNIAPLHRTDTPPRTLRGLNKPKCIQCGNVARSRCPYQSCKSCCSKAQNPCHIHVLKANATFPDKTPTLNTPLFDQHSTEVTPAVSSLRAASLRQLSTNFSQFNNLHTARSRKPLTRKEAATINEWRFSKLNEFKERNIEVENEAFDRYMQNVSLLKEVFSMNPNVEGSTDQASAEDDTGEKLKFKLSGRRSENFRKRIQQIVEVGLNKLQKRGNDDSISTLENNDTPDERKVKTERASALSDLNEKLSKARNEEDMISCLEMKAQIYHSHSQTEEGTKDVEVSEKPDTEMDLAPKPRKELDYLSQKFIRTVEIDQQDLNRISLHFSSLRKVTHL